jgi:hypothetical protein
MTCYLSLNLKPELHNQGITILTAPPVSLLEGHFLRLRFNMATRAWESLPEKWLESPCLKVGREKPPTKAA